MDHEYYKSTATWEEKFSILPRKCHISNLWLWGKHYYGMRYITGPGEPVILEYWHNKNEHLLWLLRI